MVVSKYVDELKDFSTVTMPSLPTLLYTSDIIPPTCLSLLADITATSRIFRLFNFLDFFFRVLTVEVVKSTRCLSTSVRFVSFANKLVPAFTRASVSTIAVVVPSPANEAVRSAASFIMRTARFSVGSIRLIDLATVTPSLVTVIPPTCSGDSISTVLPCGPKVLLTAFDSWDMPEINLSLPSLPNCNSLGE